MSEPYVLRVGDALKWYANQGGKAPLIVMELCEAQVSWSQELLNGVYHTMCDSIKLSKFDRLQVVCAVHGLVYREAAMIARLLAIVTLYAEEQDMHIILSREQGKP